MKKVKILRDRKVRLRLNAEHFGEGDWVETPDGIGFVDDKITSGEVDGTEAATDSPIYAVGMLDNPGVNFYKGSELEEAEAPSTDVENPVKDIKETNQTGNAITANDWTMPESWRKSDTPARVILLDAWTSMGAQFDCGGGCCMGELKSKRLCAAMKDEALGTEKWRGGWGD